MRRDQKEKIREEIGERYINERERNKKCEAYCIGQKENEKSYGRETKKEQKM